ncbi:PHM/PNGase F domain-containing protein [Scenedesmus sp. NREL 46B-D3]|nr:PHM/PNGase F domain-containing protein [Scenedesmus sp. NREL 46B-D3]
MSSHRSQLLLALLLLVTFCTLPSQVPAATSEFEITVPEETEVRGEDAYICTTLALPDKPYKLVGVEPLGRKEVVHHILLFGCDEPRVKPKDKQQSTWDCKMAPSCGGYAETILYGWGQDAPRLDLPEGVGFSVGRGSAVQWVVAQVHYLNEKPANEKAGVRLTLQDSPVPFSAGLLSYASWFSIPPRKQHFLVQNNCCYRGFQPLTSFAVRVHTHTMGRSVFMTRAPTGPKGTGHVVAAGDPQKPQGFSPVEPQVIWPGDRLTVACDFDSSGKSVSVGAGPSHDHEMCNMYLMVYAALPHIEMCNDGSSMVDERSPGNMPRAAALLPDPFPLWKPPRLTDAANKSVLGNVAGVAMGPDGTLWALHRGGRVWDEDTFDVSERITEADPIGVDVVLQMHPDTGKVLRRWGAGLFWMPHMITVDRNGSVWVADVGRHQVLKFTASGQLIMALGRKMTPGSGPRELCKPTQVAFMNDGSFLVSDGYCNSRVVRYKPDGAFAAQYELPKAAGGGNGRGGSGMGVAHSLVVDECDGEVSLADREFGRVHRFDLQSRELLATVDLQQFGKVWALAKGPYGRTLALTWKPGFDATLLDVAEPSFAWRMPNSTALWPHDFALGPAALQLTGAGDRLLAVYVAPLCEECGPVQKYVLVPQSFGAPEHVLPPPVLSAAAQRPVLAHLHVGGHPAAQAAAAAAVRAEQGGAGAGQAALEDAADGGVVTDAGEREDGAQEERVEQQEQEEYEQEVKQMADPQLVQQLQEQLQAMQAQLAEYQTTAGHDTQDFKTLRVSPWKRGGQGGASAASFIAVVVVCLLLGGGVGALAVHMLSRHAPAKANRGVSQPAMAAARHARVPQQQSIDDMLQDPEDVEPQLSGERHRLLDAGLQASSSHAGPAR